MTLSDILSHVRAAKAAGKFQNLHYSRSGEIRCDGGFLEILCQHITGIPHHTIPLYEMYGMTLGDANRRAVWFGTCCYQFTSVRWRRAKWFRRLLCQALGLPEFKRQ